MCKPFLCVYSSNRHQGPAPPPHTSPKIDASSSFKFDDSLSSWQKQNAAALKAQFRLLAICSCVVWRTYTYALACGWFRFSLLSPTEHVEFVRVGLPSEFVRSRRKIEFVTRLIDFATAESNAATCVALNLDSSSPWDFENFQQNIEFVGWIILSWWIWLGEFVTVEYNAAACQCFDAPSRFSLCRLTCCTC